MALDEATLEVVGEYYRDPKKFEEKLEEMRTLQRNTAAERIALSREQSAVNAAVQDARTALERDKAAFAEIQASAEASLRERHLKLDDREARQNEKDRGLAKQEADLKARIEQVQKREAEATRLIADGSCSLEEGRRLHEKARQTLTEMKEVIARAGV